MDKFNLDGCRGIGRAIDIQDSNREVIEEILVRFNAALDEIESLLVQIENITLQSSVPSEVVDKFNPGGSTHENIIIAGTSLSWVSTQYNILVSEYTRINNQIRALSSGFARGDQQIADATSELAGYKTRVSALERKWLP